MRNNHMFRWFYVAFFITFLFSSCTDGKGFGGGRGGGGFKGGGSRTGFSGSSGSNHIGNYGNYNRPRSGSSFRSNAMSFGAGAVGGLAAYSLMRSMSGSYHGGPGYYDRGYGGGETCVNNEDLNGTRFGQFRCPLNGFPIEARHCCGEYGKQYCCIRETTRSGFNYWNLLWLILGLLILFAIILYFLKRRQQREKNFYGVPVDITATEQQEPAFYQPQPPPMGYPPPPMGYPQPAGYPYAVPPQNYEGNFNPYAQQQMAYPPQQQMPYPPQQQMAYPPQQQMAYPPQQQVPYPTQQQSYNPYQVKEVAPPGYDDAIRNNQTKPI